MSLPHCMCRSRISFVATAVAMGIVLQEVKGCGLAARWSDRDKTAQSTESARQGQRVTHILEFQLAGCECCTELGMINVALEPLNPAQIPRVKSLYSTDDLHTSVDG